MRTRGRLSLKSLALGNRLDYIIFRRGSSHGDLIHEGLHIGLEVSALDGIKDGATDAEGVGLLAVLLTAVVGDEVARVLEALLTKLALVLVLLGTVVLGVNLCRGYRLYR